MANKRKKEITVVDENERALYAMFQNVANHLSQFYAQSVTQRKLVFEAGQTYAILQLHEWMLEKLREGRMVTIHEILHYLQDKLSDLLQDAEQPEQGASGSGQNSASAEMGPSSSAPQEEDSNPEMQMD